MVQMPDSFTAQVDFSLEERNRQNVRFMVKELIHRLIKANKCLRFCVNSIMNNEELPASKEYCWDSWDHSLSRSDASKIAIMAAIKAETNKSSKSSPQPLPPLPALKTLFNFRNGDNSNSKSTGSSPLSPPAPPLSAGTVMSQRSNLSTSSSSSSIIPASLWIVDPNHTAPFNRRPTPPPTPPVLKRSFLFSNMVFSNRKNDPKFPTTPPPTRRLQTNVFSGDQFPLTKSKSHEEHLSNRVEPLDAAITK